MAGSVPAGFTSMEIELFPNSCAISTQAFIKLISLYYKPTGAARVALNSLITGATLIGTAGGRAQVCAFLKSDYLNDAVAAVLTAKVMQISNTFLKNCNFSCASGVPAPVDILAALAQIVYDVFTADGVSIAKLFADVVMDVVCCAATLGTAAILKKINPSRIVGKLISMCNTIVAQAGDAATSAYAGSAGYGPAATTAAPLNTAVVAAVKKKPLSTFASALHLTPSGAASTGKTMNWRPAAVAVVATVAGSVIILRSRGRLRWWRRKS
jgi:hypothetical protein